MSKEVAVFGKGTILKLGDGDTPENFTEIQGITKWDVDPGGAGDPEKIDATSGSTIGMVREMMDGYSEKRPGTVDCDLVCDLDNVQHAALWDASMVGTDLNFQVVLPTKTGTKTRGFTARVSGFPLNIPHDKLVTVPMKLAIQEDSWVVVV